MITMLSNLRAYNFGLLQITAQEARKMIGNIIPAVNSTNSFFAACLINETIKYFQIKDQK